MSNDKERWNYSKGILFWGKPKVDSTAGKHWPIALSRPPSRCIRRAAWVDWLLKEERTHVNFRFKVFFSEKAIFGMGNLSQLRNFDGINQYQLFHQSIQRHLQSVSSWLKKTTAICGVLIIPAIRHGRASCFRNFCYGSATSVSLLSEFCRLKLFLWDIQPEIECFWLPFIGAKKMYGWWKADVMRDSIDAFTEHLQRDIYRLITIE